MLEVENKVVRRIGILSHVVGKDINREDIGDTEDEYIGEG
jgi:hypothetical protein